MSPYARYFEKGRSEPDDSRSELTRDRDRIIHSSALRRLQGKSQVLTAQTTDFFRTRLTHTLECAQIGRAIATRSREASWYEEADTHDEFVTLVEAACLAHDLGHPPFGHNGEQALSDMLQQVNGSTFEGNAQSFRTVTFIEAKEYGVPQVGSERWVGLNLTRNTLRALCKYPRLEAEATEGQPKFNAYSEDEDEEYFAWVWEGMALPREPTLAAQVMDVADDVAYGAHDFEDGVWAGMIPLHDLVNEDEDTLEDLRAKVLERDERRPSPAFPDGEIAEPLRQLLAPIRDEYWACRPFDRSKFSRRELKQFTASVISHFIHAVTPDGNFAPPDALVKQQRDLLTGMTWVWMIERSDLATRQYAQRGMIRALFEGYWECPEMLPRRDEWNHVQAASAPSGDRWPEKARLIRDHIAGMTDTYALEVYREMTGQRQAPLISFAY